MSAQIIPIKAFQDPTSPTSEKHKAATQKGGDKIFSNAIFEGLEMYKHEDPRGHLCASSEQRAAIASRNALELIEAAHLKAMEEARKFKKHLPKPLKK